MLVGGVVVEDDVDHLAGRHLGLERVQEGHELLMAVALHVAADDGPVEDVERSDQGRGAMALVVVRDGAEPALLQRQAGWVRSRAWIWLFSSSDSTMAWAGGST